MVRVTIFGHIGHFAFDEESVAKKKVPDDSKVTSKSVSKNCVFGDGGGGGEKKVFFLWAPP